MTGVHHKDFNYSIAFLKAFFSFCVVCAHYWICVNPSFYPSSMMLRMIGAAAPVFFITSFFLTSASLFEKDIGKLRRRLWRLYYPQFVWAIIYFAVYMVIGMILNKIRIPNDFLIQFTKKDLLWQMITGSDRYLCPQFWYQFDLIVFTLIFWLLFRFTGKHASRILVITAILCFVLQYTEWNYDLFCRFEYELWFPLGRLAEVFPFCVSGYLLYDQKIRRIIRENKISSLVISALLLVTAAFCPFIPKIQHGFEYGGVGLWIYSVTVFVIFDLLPFERIPELFKRLIGFLSKYSFGVFCIHLGVGKVWECILCPNTGLIRGTFIECIVIYLISLILSWLISLIPSKYAAQLVN